MDANQVFFVMLAAEKGEGQLLEVEEDMPSLRAAVALPDASALMKDVRLLRRDMESVGGEVAKEERELKGYEVARKEKREARQRAEREERERTSMHQEELHMRRVEAAERRLARQAALALLREKLRMECEDKAEHQGLCYEEALREAERLALVMRAEALSGRPAAGDRCGPLRETLDVIGLPPIPPDLRELIADGEDPVIAIGKVNDEYGRAVGDSRLHQSVLRAASRWLGLCTRRRSLEARLAESDEKPSSSPNATMSESKSTPAHNGPSAVAAQVQAGGGGVGAGGGGRSALMAQLAGGASMLRKVKAPDGAKPNVTGPADSKAALMAAISSRRARGSGDSAKPAPRLGKAAAAAAVVEDEAPFEKERWQFVRGMREFCAEAQPRVAQICEKARGLEALSHDLLEYFGEDPARGSSGDTLATLWRFVLALAAAKTKYERRHGPIILPSSMADELPIVVGQRVASVFGHGVVEAVRVRDSVVILRLGWGARGFIRLESLIGVGAAVSTPYGHGVVLDISRAGVYQVRLAWQAILYVSAESVRPRRGGQACRPIAQETVTDVVEGSQ